MIRTFIIDDEELARQGLISLLQTIKDIEISGSIADSTDAIELVEEAKPDLLLLDINMPGLNGFQMLSRLKYKPLVIFTTAYNEFALKAFKEHAIDYLLKPIQKAELLQAIDKAKLFINGKKTNTELFETITKILNKPAYKNRFLFDKGAKLFPVLSEEIALFFSKDKEVMAHLFNGQKYNVNDTIEGLESQLAPEQFFRVSRQALVNIRAIREINVWFKGKLKLGVTIPFTEELIISSERAQNFKHWLKSS